MVHPEPVAATSTIRSAPRSVDWSRTVFVAIQAVVLFNAIFHEPTIGYDAPAHLAYVKTLSEFRLPIAADTYEFFSPPLPYLLPAAALGSGWLSPWAAAKGGQLLNLLYSCLLCLSLMRISDMRRPRCPVSRFWSLAFLGMFPVYYKSFAFIRGEPLLALLLVLAVERLLRMSLEGRDGIRDWIALGLVLGACLLARQWAFFALPAIAIFVLGNPPGGILRSGVKGLLVSAAVTLAVAGGFYLHLSQRFGSPMAFNVPPAPNTRIGELASEIFATTHWKKLFSAPVRGSFDNEALPKLYAEFWGDYECYFLIFGIDRRNGEFVAGRSLEQAWRTDPSREWLYTNRAGMTTYLARVMLMSLVPSGLLVAAVIMGVVSAASWALGGRRTPITTSSALLALIVASNLLGYAWFVVSYPFVAGHTVKATYLLQIYPFVAVLAAELMIRIRERSVWAYRAMAGFFACSFIYDIPLLCTRYVTLP